MKKAQSFRINDFVILPNRMSYCSQSEKENNCKNGIMTEKKKTNKTEKVLQDHVLKGKKLVAPFNTQVPVKYSSYTRNVIPELIWLSILNKRYGYKETTEIYLGIIEALKEIKPDSELWWGRVSDYSTLISDEASAMREILLKKTTLFKIQTGLSDFVALYSECPLQVFYSKKPVTENKENALIKIKEIIKSIYYKRSVEATFMQAQIVYGGLFSSRVQDPNGLIRKYLDEIENDPESDDFKMGSASICATINLLVGGEFSKLASPVWRVYFWQKGLELEGVDLSGLEPLWKTP